MTHTLTPSQRLTGATVEGLYRLTALLLRLVESTLLLTAFTVNTPTLYIGAALAAGVYSLVLAPLRVGRQIWYCRLAEQPRRVPPIAVFWSGWRHWRGAIGWRWSRFWRLTALLLVSASPAALLWGYADRLTRLGNGVQSLLWSLLGTLALLGGLGIWCVRRSRYALVPLLLAEGHTAPLAMQVSIAMMRGRTREWINFWGEQAGRLLLCLLFPPSAFWLLPTVHLSYTTRLNRWLSQGRSKMQAS
ncbi:MAG: hypothetical protein IJO76_02300 [Clostridia bacterium]|nr:hypothetical protein [Clostridia bacterium]